MPGGARCRSFEAISALPGARLHYIMFDQSAPVENHTQWDWLTFHLGSTGYQPPPVLVRLGEEIRSEGRSRSKIIFPVTEKSSIGILWRSIHMLLPDIFWDPFNYGMSRYPGSPDPGICLCMLMERSIIYSLFWMISSSAGASHRIPRSIFSGTAPRSNTRIFSISSLTEATGNGRVPSLPMRSWMNVLFGNQFGVGSQSLRPD